MRSHWATAILNLADLY